MDLVYLLPTRWGQLGSVVQSLSVTEVLALTSPSLEIYMLVVEVRGPHETIWSVHRHMAVAHKHIQVENRIPEVVVRVAMEA